MTAQSSPPSIDGSVSSFGLSAALFLISFATVLFTLSIWKLLSFFIMPSLFFDLLFVGFPVGAFLGVRFFTVSRRSLVKTLWILQAVMILSILACLVCKHFDYLRAHLFEVELAKLVGQMGIFTAFFIPFFCAYGLSEYIGYQVGRQVLKGRMSVVYALYLFGAAFGYLFMELVLHRHLFLEVFGQIGVSHLLVLSLVLVAIATSTLSLGRAARWVFRIEALLLLGALATPSLEASFLHLYKGSSPQSTKTYLDVKDSFGQPVFKPAFQRWGHYSLTEILEAPFLRQFTGFYNDLMQWEYSTGTGFSERMLGAIPMNHLHRTAPGGRIAIIGSGGGRQVKWSLQPSFAFEKILALELEPAVFAAVREALVDPFDRVYEGSTVEPVLHEARGYMEDTDETFDLIFLPSVGGYPQMMLEPGNMIRTIDAYRTLRERLTEMGILAIWYPSGLDPQRILTQQYLRTLGAQGLKMRTRGYVTVGKDPGEYLILAAKSPKTVFPSPEEIDAFLLRPSHPFAFGLPALPPGARTEVINPPDDPSFKPITDEQPFLAGNVQHIFSLEQVYTLLATAGGFLLLVGAALLFGLRRRGDPRIRGRSYWQVAGLSLLIGANFILFEHYAVLALFKTLYVYHQALVIGAISFLVLSGLGSVFITRRTRSAFLLLAVCILLGLVAAQFLGLGLPPAAVIACVAPVAFVTGSLFPALFELAARNPLTVFAMDAVGAALGSMLSFFIPIAFGFAVFFPVGAAVFLLTAYFTWRFYRDLEGEIEESAL